MSVAVNGDGPQRGDERNRSRGRGLRLSQLRQPVIDDMRMRQLSPRTQANHLRVVREFSRYLGRSPDTATVEDLRGYRLHLVDHGTSPVSLNSTLLQRDGEC